ncbi:hypothetical protein EMCRGX_G010647 [Ephydatia muelleri]
MAALPVPVLAPAVFPTPDLHDFQYSDLFKATEDEISAIAWCQNNGLIAKDTMDYVIQDELQFQLGIVGEHTIVDWRAILFNWRQGVLELAAELADVKRDGAGVSTDDGRMTWL